MKWFHVVSAVLGIVRSSLAARDWSVCQDPTYTCGPLPPLIPESYIMKYEWIDLVRNQTAWVEEYFDTEYLRAKISVVLRGTKVTSIYDYFAETVTTYNSDRPGAKPSLDPESQDTCEIEEMSTYRGVRLPFGYKYRGERPRQSRMDSSYEALRFGGPYRVQYVRPATGEETRHLPADMFESCAYDKNEDATYRMRYYRSANASFFVPKRGSGRSYPYRAEGNLYRPRRRQQGPVEHYPKRRLVPVGPRVFRRGFRSTTADILQEQRQRPGDCATT